MGQALTLEVNSYWAAMRSSLSRFYITKWKSFHVGGEEIGKYGYRLTFAIAYLRDLAMEFGVLGESFETSVPWDKVLGLCRNVKTLIKRLAKNLGVQYPVSASSDISKSFTVTQVYDAGACVYFYFGFNTRGLHNGLEVYDKIETAARDEIIACGGSISHHHGIGKLRKQWMLTTQGVVGIALLKAIKMELDPANIFADANLVDIIGSPHSKL
ncbi:Alkyldihydroxyacetonephosphate synthase [Parelaphostrongylus tenuis]|uniref:Alkylglycerone-phosphate synthase n=1 Tax=Parelaphostrongylus tenuis TaxID=148309 RepID=A0AAD5MWU6_PARTN|nr:Alkyldihydroxyacetonephosphate synthase [Parelaphostrongylus tenuis]